MNRTKDQEPSPAPPTPEQFAAAVKRALALHQAKGRKSKAQKRRDQRLRQNGQTANQALASLLGLAAEAEGGASSPEAKPQWKATRLVAIIHKHRCRTCQRDTSLQQPGIFTERQGPRGVRRYTETPPGLADPRLPRGTLIRQGKDFEVCGHCLAQGPQQLEANLERARLAATATSDEEALARTQARVQTLAAAAARQETARQKYLAACKQLPKTQIAGLLVHESARAAEPYVVAIKAAVSKTQLTQESDE